MDSRQVLSGHPTGSAAQARLRPYTSWPPPGLERIQGDLRTVTGELYAGGLVFTMPLLAAAAIQQDFWSLGLLGESWWILVLTSVIGLALIGDGFVDLFRLLRRAAHATDQGYRRRTIAMVVCDGPRDAGFLLQGAREFSELNARVRAELIRARIARHALLLAGALWLSFGFVTGVLLAARSALDERGLALWTLVPVSFLVLAAALLRWWENGRVRAARRDWHKKEHSRELQQSEVLAWHQTLADRPGAIPVPVAEVDRGRGLRVLAGASLVLPVLLVAVGLPLLMISAIGPILAKVAVPTYTTTQRRSAQGAAVADYRVAPDSSITALEAGEALIALASVNDDPSSVDALARPPLRRYDSDIFPSEGQPGGPTNMEPGRWATELLPRVRQGLEPEIVAYLERVGAHPAIAELKTLARASEMDEAGATWVLPLPAGTSRSELPIPRFSGVREAAYAHVGGAIADAARGRDADAEMRLREVISAGLIMGQEGTTLISNLVGLVIANMGAQALAELYDVTGRPAEGEALRGRLEAADRVAESAEVSRRMTPYAALRAMPGMVTDDNAIRGLRWEYFVMLNALGPCINPNRGLFGTGPEYEDWRLTARAGLVRSPAEDELFRVASGGWFGQEPELGLGARALDLLLGRPGQGSCVAALRALQ